jgi:uncharacterized domain 1
MNDPKARAIFDTMMAKDFYSQWLQIEPIELQEAYCKIKMNVRQDMLNGHGTLHGGVAFSFADSAFAFASNSLGRVAVSIDGHIQFAKAARVGETLLAEAKALEIGYKIASFDVNISNLSGVIYYRFRGTVYRTSTTFEKL